jgi:hypothetical protein
MIRILLLLPLLLTSFIINGQNNHSIKAAVRDSAELALPGANVWLIKDLDSLHTTTDNNGNFEFKNVPYSSFSIKISILGYDTYRQSFTFSSGDQNIQLPNIYLNVKSNILKEVVIKSKFSPLTLKEDTIEYSIKQYHLRENAQLDDLLRRLPGLEVNRDGSIKFMGQPISKIKINGREYIVNNLHDILGIIPLEALDKIQIIDDYGKMAELTGRKTGVTTKVINLETQADVGSTKTILAQLGGGTDNKHNIDIIASHLDNKKQIHLAASTDNSIMGPGETSYDKAVFVYRNQLNNSLLTHTRLLAERGSNDRVVNSSIKTILNEGNIDINNTNRSSSSYNNYDFTEMLDLKGKYENNVNIRLYAQRKDQTDRNTNTSIQSGLQNIHQVTDNNIETVSPRFQSEIYGVLHFKRQGELIAYGLNIESTQNEVTQNARSNYQLYNPDNSLAYDSLFNQVIKNNQNTQTINTQLSYIKPGRSDKTSFELKYNLYYNNNQTNQETKWVQPDGKLRNIDSLSYKFSYPIVEQKAGLNLKSKTEKAEFILGFNFLYSTFGNTHSQYLIPELNFKYKLSAKNQFSLQYYANQSFPTYNQTRPVADRTNPLFTIIGNPFLKSTLTNRASIDFRHVSNAILLVNIGASPITNQITTNTITETDASNSLIQETHYLNTNGVYSLNGNYAWSRPFSEGKYQIFVEGNAAYNNNIFYIESLRNNTKNMVLTQSLRTGIYQKWVELNTGAAYTINQTKYSDTKTPITTIGSLNFNFNAKFFALKTWSLWLDFTKQFNTGYASGVSANPTDLGATIEKTFLKNTLTCRLQGYNLLDQNTGLSQTISGNTTIQTRTNQLGRFIMLSVILDLKKTKK